jgi:DNA-binding response OmpR family regulator
MGADDCLAKPVSPARLLEKVAALVTAPPREPAEAERNQTPPE